MKGEREDISEMFRMANGWCLAWRLDLEGA